MTVRKSEMKAILNKISAVIIIAIAVICMSTAAFAFEVNAADDYTVQVNDGDYILCTNDVSGYDIIIDDAADLFRDSEKEQLIPYMVDCAGGGHVMLVTVTDNRFGSAYDYCENYYRSIMPEESGIMFLIDLDTRELRFYSEGTYHRELTSSVMNIISDNIYKMASNGDYFGCAKEAFAEIADVLEGKRIAAPMKYVSNACLAILLALILSYFFTRGVSKAAKPSNSEIMNAIYSSFEFRNPGVKFVNETRRYSPRSSGSGGGGGGGGGGHSSGGHSF